LSVWKDNAIVDPFTNAAADAQCNAQPPAAQLWVMPIQYLPTQVLGSGIVSDVPSSALMRETPANLATLPANAPALIFWADIAGIRKDDVLELTVTDPDGSLFAQDKRTMDRDKAQFFSYAGKRNRASLKPGIYKASVRLLRPGETLPVIDF